MIDLNSAEAVQLTTKIAKVLAENDGRSIWHAWMPEASVVVETIAPDVTIDRRNDADPA